LETNVSIDDGNKNEGRSTPEPEDNVAPEEIEVYEAAGEDNPEEEYCFYKLERLAKQLDEAPCLHPEYAFIQSAYAQQAKISKKEFYLRLKDFLEEFQQDIPGPGVIDELLRSAIEAKKQIAAWESTVQAIKSKEFRTSLDYLREEVERVSSIRKLVIKRSAEKAPQWMASWEQLWIEAFEELEEDIEGQLRGAKQYLESLSNLAKLGRTEVESQVLLLSRNSIHKVIAQTSLSKTPSVALAALAYAAQLVVSRNDEDDAKGRYLDAIKRRMTRAKRSKAQVVVGATLLQGMVQKAESQAQK
jgi:hypothetical protein